MLDTDWREHYQAALREVNPAELQGRMREAENAILSRLQTLTQDSESCVERQAIGEALARLRTLRINALYHGN
jgi:hypothetical protein